MFESATFKLTVWYMTIVMAISISFSVVIYNIATYEIDRGLDWQSQRIIDRYPGLVENNPRLIARPDAGPGSHRLLLRLILLNLLVLAGAGLASYWLARRSLEPIEAAHWQQKRFTADVSHELRTPLTAIKMEGEVALLNNKASAKELKETITSTLEEVTKLETLINNLLRLSRLEAEELQQTFTPVSNQAIITEAVGQLERVAAAKNITIEQNVTAANTLGDHESLVQLLIILLDNAIKFSPAKSTIVIQSASTKSSLTMSVTDKGSGIPRKDLEHIFDRFYQADNSRTKNATTGQGHGLGLSIAQMIADMHKGSITIKSQPKHGTTATIILPLPTSQA